MNESVIKEIKSIYSRRIKTNNKPSKKGTTPKSKNTKAKTFFNGVIDKLNIEVSKQD